jgi:hypothetical protein
MATKKKLAPKKKAVLKKTAPARKEKKFPVISANCTHTVRGYFGLQDHEHIVNVTSSADFLLYIWARNVETFHGGIEISTPPSQFRGSGSSGPQDALLMDVPAQTGLDLGCIGAQKGETISITPGFGARVTVYLTVVTSAGASVGMTWS